LLIIVSLLTLPGSNYLLANEDRLLDLAGQHYELGNRYFREGKYKEAQLEYEKAKEILDEVSQSSSFTIEEFPAKKKEYQVMATGLKNSSELAKTAVAKPDSQQTTSTQAQVRGFTPLEYTLSEEDVLYISVWDNSDLNQEVIVRPDGRISFSLVGDIPAAGLTITQLKESITDKLREYIKNPVVSISIRKMGGAKIIMLGEVLHPGVYNVTGAKSVLEAIGLAGGFTRDAVASSVVVVKNPHTNPTALRLNLNKALKGDASQNIILEKEDIVFVPKKFIADLNYFLNQILEPISRGVYTADTINRF